MKYNWQQPDWTNFKYDHNNLDYRLYQLAQQMGRLSGTLNALSKTGL